MSLLEVQDLSVTFATPDGLLEAVRGLSFSLEEGKTLGIVGESGSGKSVSTQTILGLTQNARVAGHAVFDGTDLLQMSQRELRRVRGAQIAMIFQDPLSSLHPYYRVGWQIVELIREHEDVSKDAARRRAIDLLGAVGIARPDTRVDDYPHQFSGGMRQRAMIAMAMALNPKILIADEPTTALDVTVQAQVLEVMQKMQQEFGTAIILITHDLGVVADMADDVLVMYAGRAIERADRRTTYYSQHHPYTKGLLDSIPTLGKDDRLRPIAGQPPSLLHLPSGCSFRSRCTYVMPKCITDEPPLLDVGGAAGHRSACWLPAQALGSGDEAEKMRHDKVAASRAAATATSMGASE
ncbi:MAG TPA: ABC transporter ATP-binding protein [Mycobacteriales bacterium]|nr:ABC transporter ATP-binding protein [Mycobacteriales bacterium]